jgi:hypothetical protein
MTKLTIDDIADLRAYEREREAFRDHVIALKRRRRVQVGELVTLLFENRDTIRFQIQVGIERAVVLHAGAEAIRATVEESHDDLLTRDDVTASVHYVRWELTPSQVEQVAAGPVRLALDHPEYAHEAVLGADTVAELLADLRGTPVT